MDSTTTQNQPDCDGSAASLHRLVRRLEDAERGLEQTIKERDTLHLIADMLAEAIADFTGEDIGEHSSANCPWTNALDAIAAMKPPNDGTQVP